MKPHDLGDQRRHLFAVIFGTQIKQDARGGRIHPQWFAYLGDLAYQKRFPVRRRFDEFESDIG
jgi:hypothetical protein